MAETKETYNLNLATQALQEEGIVALKLSNLREQGAYESWICIHTLGHNEYHPYAVHRLILIDDHPDGLKHSYEGGDYCETLEEALKVFAQRR